MPLLWDEYREETLINQGDEVVGLAGCRRHAAPGYPQGRRAVGSSRSVFRRACDVGGGYPDESLSYIPLLWMMDEDAGRPPRRLRFLPSFVQRATELAQIPSVRSTIPGAASAPIIATMPRKLTAWLASAACRDHSRSAIRKSIVKLGRTWPAHGVKVHESAIIRTISGIDQLCSVEPPGQFPNRHGQRAAFAAPLFDPTSPHALAGGKAPTQPCGCDHRRRTPGTWSGSGASSPISQP